MKLIDIHFNFGTDKGVGHNYLQKYDELFEPIRLNKMNILEIGVLFGNSLKMWEHYFQNSIIYGIDDFSQSDGSDFHNFKLINADDIISDLQRHNRIKFNMVSCEDENTINQIFKDIKFDIIIDDASHNLNQQINNYRIFNNFLNDNFIYICEDVQTEENGHVLGNYFKSLSPNKKVEMFNFNINDRTDDRIVIVT
jgi:hypothetical protein